MPDLETNVAKIKLGSSKQSATYVYLTAEPGAHDSELFAICELPVLNPAVIPEWESLSQAIAGSMRRVLKKPTHESTFEAALAQINEELGKLAGLGKTQWFGKLNALIAVNVNGTLSVAVTGKMTALLLRDGTATPVAEPSTPTHPLKTFENFSVGKLKLGDAVIFSTNQLFNYISLDRVQDILRRRSLTQAVDQIGEIVEENAGPEVTIGAIIAEFREPQLYNEPAGLPEDPGPTGKAAGALAVLARVQAWLIDAGKKLPSLIRNGLSQRPRPDVKTLIAKNKQVWNSLNRGLRTASQQFHPQQFRTFSRQKQFVAISAAVLLVAVIINVAVAKHYQTRKQVQAQTAQALIQAGKNINDANAAWIYHSEGQARDLLKQANNSLAGLRNFSSDQQKQVSDLQKQIQTLQDKMERKTTLTAVVLATLGSADRMITLPKYFATETNRTLVSYDRGTGRVQDNALKTDQKIAASAAVSATQAVIYNGTQLLLWDYTKGAASNAWTEAVPGNSQASGLVWYSVNNRVYLVDKKNNRVLSFLAGSKGFSKPVISVDKSSADFSQALDLAVDGNVYVLMPDGIHKFQSGRAVDFSTGLSGFAKQSKIITDASFKNIYVLDAGNKKIIILDKKGQTVKTILSPQLSQPKDFAVDEKGKIIYMLNDNTLLKLNF